MAIRLFNSVGGYSVGETPANVILANSDITLGYVVSSTLPGNANIYLSAGNGNLYTTRLLTDNLLHANGVAWDFLQAGGSTGQLQFNNAGDLGGSANLTFDGTNLLTLTGTGNITNLNSSGNANVANLNANGTVNFTSSANVTLGPVSNIHISGGSTGYVLQTNGSGALTWVSPSSVGIGGSNTQVEFNDNGSFAGSANFTFNKTSNTLAVDNINLVATGTANLGNLVIANYHQGTLTTGAQPNITSVGTLTSLTVTANANSGNIYTGNVSVTGAVLSSWIPATNNTYDLGNSSSAWRNVWAGSNIFIGGSTGYIRATGNVIKVDAFQSANNANVGSLTVQGATQLNSDLTVQGNLTVAGSTTYLNVTNLAVEDLLIDIGGSGNGANLTSYDGKDRGLLLHNYDSHNLTGPINQAWIWSSVNNEFRAIADVLSISSGVVTPNVYANIHGLTFIGNVNATTVAGNLTTNAQPNITSVGTLSSLTVSGTFIASGLTYPTTDGTSGQFLKTNGSGVLSWSTVSTSSITNGTSNVNVAASGNVTVTAAGNTTVTITPTGANITGYANVTGTITANNVTANTITGISLVTGNSTQGATTVTSSSTSAKILATFPVTGINGVEYFVKGVDTNYKYTIAKIHAVTDGANVDWDVFGGISLSSGVGAAGGQFVVSIASGNIQIAVTPSSSNSTTWTTKYTTI